MIGGGRGARRPPVRRLRGVERTFGASLWTSLMTVMIALLAAARGSDGLLLVLALRSAVGPAAARVDVGGWSSAFGLFGVSMCHLGLCPSCPLHALALLSASDRLRADNGRRLERSAGGRVARWALLAAPTSKGQDQAAAGALRGPGARSRAPDAQSRVWPRSGAGRTSARRTASGARRGAAGCCAAERRVAAGEHLRAPGPR